MSKYSKNSPITNMVHIDRSYPHLTLNNFQAFKKILRANFESYCPKLSIRVYYTRNITNIVIFSNRNRVLLMPYTI